MKTQAIIKEPRFMTPGLALADSLRREGKYAEARAVLADETTRAGGDDARLACAVSLAKVERGAGHPALALKILLEAAPLDEASKDEELRARFHHGLAVTYQLLGEADASLIEYAAAAFHWSEAGLHADAGCADNNVALLVAPFDRARAYTHLERARGHFSGMPVKLAEVDETEARIRLGGRESGAALDLALGAVQVFRRTGETALLLDALPTLIKAAADHQAELAEGRGGAGD